jgi:hypothetical protein
MVDGPFTTQLDWPGEYHMAGRWVDLRRLWFMIGIGQQVGKEMVGGQGDGRWDNHIYNWTGWVGSTQILNGSQGGLTSLSLINKVIHESPSYPYIKCHKNNAEY